MLNPSQFGGAIGEGADAQDARKAAQLDALRAGRIQWYVDLLERVSGTYIFAGLNSDFAKKVGVRC